MTLSIIAAVTPNHVIGRDNDLPWSLPEDMRYFKQKTMGHRLIMGRNTFFSLKKPLSGRQNVVISQSLTKELLFMHAGIGNASLDNNENLVLCRTIEEALALPQWGEFSEVFCMGGAQLYKAMLPLADTLYLTELEQDVPGDAYFPEWDRAQWVKVKSEVGEACPVGQKYYFSVYERK